MIATLETDQDYAWRAAYSIAWIGASNPVAVTATLSELTRTVGSDHEAVQAIAGHLAYLKGDSLGPEAQLLEAVVSNGRRLGIHPIRSRKER